MEKTIKKLKQTVARWHLYFAEKREKDGHIYQALEEYAKYKIACEQGWIIAFALEKITVKIKKLICKKDLIYKAFEAKLDEIQRFSQRRREENRECFITYALEEDIQGWIKDNLVVDLQQAGMAVRLDVWGEINPGKDPNIFTTKRAKVTFVIIVTTPTYKDEWDIWAKSKTEGGVTKEVSLLMNRFTDIVTKDKGAVFVIVRKGNRENAIPTFFPSSKSLDYNKDDNYFKNTLEIAGTFHKLEDKVYLAVLESFEEERKAILGKDLTSDDYTEAEMWLKSRTEKRKVFYLPDEKSNTSVTLTVNAPIPNSDFVGRKEELNQLNGALKKGKYGAVALISEEGVKSGKTEIAKKYFYEQLENYAYAFWVSAKDSIPSQFKKIAERLKLAHENKTSDEISQHVKEHLEKSANWLLIFDGAEEQEDIFTYLPQAGGHVIVTSRNSNWLKFHSISVDVFNENDAVAFLRRIAALSHEQEVYGLKDLALELDYLPVALQEAGTQMYRRYDARAYRRYKEAELSANRKSLDSRSSLPEREVKCVGLERNLRTLEEKFKTENTVVITADTNLDDAHKKHIALEYAYRNAGKKYGFIRWFDATNPTLISKGYENLFKELKLEGKTEVEGHISEKITHKLKEEGLKWLFIFDKAKDQKSLNPYLPSKNINGNILITSKSQEWVGIKKLPVQMTFSSKKAVRYFCSMVKEDNYTSEQKAKALVEELRFFPLAIKQAATYIVAAKTSVLEQEVSIEEYFQLFKNEREKLLQTSGLPSKNSDAFIIRATLNIAVKKILEEEEKEKRIPIGFTLRLINFCTQQDDDISRASLKKWIGQNFGWENVDFYEENALNRLERYTLMDLTKDAVSVHQLVREGVRNMFIEKNSIETLNINTGQPNKNTLTAPAYYYNLPNENPYFVGRNAERQQLKDLLEQHGRVVLTSKSGIKIGKTEIAKKYVFECKKKYTHIFWISAESKIHEELGKEDLEKHSEWLIVCDNAKNKDSILPYLPTSGGHVIITSREQNWGKFHSIEINPLKKEDACMLLAQISEQPHNHKIEELVEELDALPEALQEAGTRMKAVQEGVDWYRITTEEQLAKNAAYLKERSNLPTRNKKFTGREFALRKLEEALQAKPNTPIVLTAETGLGGAGKTQIALQYAYRSTDARKKRYDFIWWFHAETPTAITGEYESLAKKLGIVITEENRKQNRVIERIVCYLRGKKMNWLFIFDNAENQETLTPYLPSMGGDIIITSRNKEWKGIEKFEVTVFQPEESIRYLCKVVGKKDADFKEKARELTGALGHLPLALAQTAAYIAKTKLPVEEYTQRFVVRRKELWNFTDPPREDDYKLTVSVTWDITMQKIEEEEKLDARFSPLPSSCALNLMHLCACLAPNDIPSDWLKEWIEQTYKKSDSSFFAGETIGRLFHYSMIDLTETFVSVHKLVQVVTQDNASDAEREEFIRQALELVESKFESYEDEKPENWKIGRECLPHAVSVTNHALKEKHFLNNENLKKFLSTELNPEITDLERIDLQKEIFYRSKQGKTVLLFGKMGTYALHQGNAFEAKEYYTQALEIYKTFFGNNHPDVADTLNNLGNAWSNLGEKKKVIQYYTQALEIFKAFYGDCHPKVAITLNNLGAAWSDLGERKKAIEFYDKALKIKTAFYSNNHPSVAETLNNLGLAYSDLGEQKKAIEFYEQALEIKKNLYGSSHPSVAEILNNLSVAWNDLGQKNKATQFCTEALQIFKVFFGNNHPSVANTLNNLGVAWSNAGETKKAIKYYTQALETFTTFYGDCHPQVARTLSNLGLAWADLIEKEKAMEYYEKAMEIFRAFYGSSHPEIGYLLNNLGEVWSDLNQNEKAIESSTQALQIFKEFYGNSHPAVASVLKNLGRTWSNVGQYKKAIALCEQSLDIYKCFYGTEHLAIVETLYNLGNAWSALGEYKKAIEHYQITSSFYEKRDYKRTKPKMVANNLTALGTAYNKLNKYKNAARHYKAAIKVIHQANNVSFEALAMIVTIRCIQACNYSDQCKYTKAKAHLSDALYILCNLHILLKPFISHDYGEEYAVSLPITWRNAGKALKYSPDEAESAVRCLTEGLKKTSIFDTTDKYVLLRAELWNALGIVIHNLDQEENHAKKCFEKAVEGFNAFYGERHPRVAVVRLNLAESQRKLGNLQAAFLSAESALELFKQFFNDPHPHILQALNLFGKIYHDRGDFEKSYEYHKAALSQAKKCYPTPDTHIDKGEAYIGLGNAMRGKDALEKSRDYFVKADIAFARVCGEVHLTIAKCNNFRGQIYQALAEKTTSSVKRIRYDKKALSHYKEAYRIAKKFLDQNHPNVLRYQENVENLQSKKPEELPSEEKKDSTNASPWYTRPLRITTIPPREEHSPTDLSTTAANTEVCQKESPLSPESKDTQATSFSAQVFAKLQHFLTPLTGRKESIEREKGTFDSFLKTIRSIAVLTYDPADPQSGPFLKKLDRIGDIVLGFFGFGAACVVATVNLINTGKKIDDYKKGKVLRQIAGENDGLLQSEANRLQKNVTNLQGVLSFFNTTKSVLDLAGGATSLTSQFITSIGPIVRSALGFSLCTAALPLILNWHVNTIRNLIRERRVRKEAESVQKTSMLSEEDAQVQITPQYHLITAYRTYKGKKKAQKENYSLYRPVEVDAENSINKMACFHRLSKQRHWSLVTTTHLFQSVVDFVCSAAIATLFASTLFGFSIAIAGVNLIPILNFLVWGLAFTAAGIALYGIYLNASRNNRQKNTLKELNILDKMLKILETLEKRREQQNAILNQIQALTLVGKLEELTREKKKEEELSHVLNELKDLQDREGLHVIMNELAPLNVDHLIDHLNTIKELLMTELKEYEVFKGLRDNSIMKSAALFQQLYEATSNEEERFTKMETFVQTQLWKRDANRMARYAVTNMNAFRDIINTYLQYHSEYQNEEKKEAFLNSLHIDEQTEFSKEAQELTDRKSQMEVATNLLKDAMNW